MICIQKHITNTISSLSTPYGRTKTGVESKSSSSIFSKVRSAGSAEEKESCTGWPGTDGQLRGGEPRGYQMESRSLGDITVTNDIAVVSFLYQKESQRNQRM